MAWRKVVLPHENGERRAFAQRKNSSVRRKCEAKLCLFCFCFSLVGLVKKFEESFEKVEAAFLLEKLQAELQSKR